MRGVREFYARAQRDVHEVQHVREHDGVFVRTPIYPTQAIGNITADGLIIETKKMLQIYRKMVPSFGSAC
jgi:hypothetical protein